MTARRHHHLWKNFVARVGHGCNCNHGRLGFIFVSTPAVRAKTTHIEPGRLWEHDYIEGFNTRLRDELLNGEAFYTLR